MQSVCALSSGKVVSLLTSLGGVLLEVDVDGVVRLGRGRLTRKSPAILRRLRGPAVRLLGGEVAQKVIWTTCEQSFLPVLRRRRTTHLIDRGSELAFDEGRDSRRLQPDRRRLVEGSVLALQDAGQHQTMRES